ncbi:MAG: hypothetical protein JXB50_04080 [Spirochaetes bacterium]|nr:hypothetical protein [Spirochaetota bacterium]
MNKSLIIVLSVLLTLIVIAIAIIILQSDIINFINNNEFLSNYLKIEDKTHENDYQLINKDKILYIDNEITDLTTDMKKDDIFISDIEEDELKKYVLKNGKLYEKKSKYTYKSFFSNKGSDFDSINFNALGEYVSSEEREYRYNIVKGLKVKTIIIDHITKGNGISQEYYKVAYKTNMIPSKILDQLVESKEFRDLIPRQYLNTENKLSTLKKGQKIKFTNSDISELLILWCNGRLSPVRKAWETKAVR